MSSFKNAAQAQRRTHRERSQPAFRKKFGLLEKHKDYVVRAKDFNKKKRILKQLRTIADDKNPDEYYRGMIKSSIVDGKHKTAKDNSLSAEALKLFKTQDANYLQVKLQAEKQKITKLQSILHDTGHEKINTHTVFVDSDSEVDEFNPDNFEMPLKRTKQPPEVHKALCKIKKQQYYLLRLRVERAESLQQAASKLKVSFLFLLLLKVMGTWPYAALLEFEKVGIQCLSIRVLNPSIRTSVSLYLITYTYYSRLNVKCIMPFRISYFQELERSSQL